MDTHVWLAYIVTAILFSLAPGSGTVNSISNGLSYGTKKSLASIAGLQLGLTFHIMLVGAGIGALVALFPQFINPTQPQVPQLLVLGVTTVLIDSVVMLGYTSLASQMGRFIRSDRIMNKINKIFGGMFMGCGALLAAAKA